MRYELIYVPRINMALKAQVEQYIKHKDVLYVTSAGLYAVLLDLYKQTGSVWARHSKTLYRQAKASGQMGFSERIITLMQQYFGFDLLNDAEGITQTTKRLIQQVLSDALIDGLSFDEIVKQIESPEFTATRARLIARTETVNAANAGSLVTAKLAGATKKIWISARDSRVRIHHAEVNQTVIGVDDKFRVGTSLMDHPGDKDGGANECCNCRCVMAGIP